LAADPEEELYERRRRAMAGGGPERIARQHAAGKLTARERLDRFFDPGTFTELDLFVRHRGTEFGLDRAEAPADGVVTGFGAVDGRLVYAFAQDFTVLGGSLGEMHAKKITKVQDLAFKAGAPLVGFADSGGARIQEGIDALNGYGEIFRRNTLASGVIPQISCIVGPSAGGAVYSPALTDFVLMVEGTAQMYITGPQVIRQVTGEVVTHEALGGAATHARRSGVAHLTFPDEDSLFRGLRRLLSYLPANHAAKAPRAEPRPPDPEALARAASVVPADPNKPYDVRDLFALFLDADSFFEIQPAYAQNMVVGFGRVRGEAVAVVGNQPKVLAGCLDIDASVKLARFVRFADAFGLPILTVVDTPGYLPGTAQEYGGIIRHGAKVLYAYSEATVPKVSIVSRKAYGGAYLAMCSRSLGADLVFALPTAEVAVMGPEGAAEIIFRQELQDADDPVARRIELVEVYRRRFLNPYVAAAHGYVDAVVAPGELRAAVERALWSLAAKREERPAKRHGNIPL
jgi:acetyl-CoA carboxylase carboxyltransferase component